jgi:hypothetical protein
VSFTLFPEFDHDAAHTAVHWVPVLACAGAPRESTARAVRVRLASASDAAHAVFTITAELMVRCQFHDNLIMDIKGDRTNLPTFLEAENRFQGVAIVHVINRELRSQADVREGNELPIEVAVPPGCGVPHVRHTAVIEHAYAGEEGGPNVLRHVSIGNGMSIVAGDVDKVQTALSGWGVPPKSERRDGQPNHVDAVGLLLNTSEGFPATILSIWSASKGIQHLLVRE